MKQSKSRRRDKISYKLAKGSKLHKSSFDTCHFIFHLANVIHVCATETRKEAERERKMGKARNRRETVATATTDDSLSRGRPQRGNIVLFALRRTIRLSGTRSSTTSFRQWRTSIMIATHLKTSLVNVLLVLSLLAGSSLYFPEGARHPTPPSWSPPSWPLSSPLRFALIADNSRL